jgi:hypothetical protein
MVFLCDVYHQLAHHVDYLANTQPAPTPNGRVVIIDYYDHRRSGTLGFSKRHLISKEQVIKELNRPALPCPRNTPSCPANTSWICPNQTKMTP